MKILITGGSGFLGSALAHYWQGQGHELCLLLRAQSNTRRIEHLLDKVNVGLIAKTEECLQVVNDFSPDAIVHTACSYGRVNESLLDVADVNIHLGLALIQAVLTIPDRKTVFINTGTVLNSNVSTYALTKSQFSSLGDGLAQLNSNRLQFINVRLQQMYGHGDDRTKFTTHIIETCRAGEERLALTRGEQYRDFIYIDDTVSAYDTIIRHAEKFSANDEIDVGSGQPVTMRSFAEMVSRLTASSTILDFGSVPYRLNEAMLCSADIQKLMRLGWKAKFSLEEGIRQTIQTNK